MAGFLAGKWADRLRIPAVLCLGISLGLLWFHGYNTRYLCRVSDFDGQLADVQVYCTDYSYQTDYGCAVEGFLYVDGKPVRVKFYVNDDVQIEPGDILTGTYSLRVTTADGELGGTYHQGKGIFLLGYQREDASLIRRADKPLWAYPAIMRRNITNTIEALFPSDTAGFAKALLLGDRTDIGYELNTSFKISGIMHIIAVSGLHVTILFTLINLLCLKRRWLVALIGIPSLILFAAVAGFSASVVRACLMQILMIGAAVLNREYDGPTELSFSVLVMMAVNPLTVTSVSFQLSVGSMIGIFLFQKKLYDWFCDKLGCGKNHKLVNAKRWLAGSVSVTLSATSLTMPLSAYYFGAVSLIGVLTNLLVLWAVGLIFYGIIATCVCSLLPSLAGGIAAGISWLIRYVLTVADRLAAVPFAAVYTQSIYIVAWLIFSYALLALIVFGKEKRIGRSLGCIAAGLVISIAASRLELRMDDVRMTVLDVGQGQCILLQSDDRTYMVDCGGDYDADAADLAAEMLLTQGVDQIDGLILTHFDRDHAGGAVYLLSRIPAQTIYIPDQTDGRGIRETLEMEYADILYVIDEDIQISFGLTNIAVYPATVADSNNDASLAVLFHRETCDILITGDRSGFSERLLLNYVDIPQLDVLVAGHHGSNNSTCEELLAATVPKIVAISVGDNSYGHPAEELLERIARYGCAVYRTDLDGNLIIRR